MGLVKLWTCFCNLFYHIFHALEHSNLSSKKQQLYSNITIIKSFELKILIWIKHNMHFILSWYGNLDNSCYIMPPTLNGGNFNGTLCMCITISAYLFFFVKLSIGCHDDALTGDIIILPPSPSSTPHNIMVMANENEVLVLKMHCHTPC